MCKFYFFTRFLGKQKGVHNPRDGMVLAMATALTDMNSGSTAKIKAGMRTLITDRELKEAVMGVIDEG